jgi:hypothetical protein
MDVVKSKILVLKWANLMLMVDLSYIFKYVYYILTGTPVTVRAQFGRVGVNNPTVLLRNYTPSSVLESSSFATLRIVPTSLPLFTPPQITPIKRVPTFREIVRFYYLK